MFKLIIALLFLSANITGKEKELDKFLKVEGIGLVKAQPDYAIINIGVYNVNR